MMSTSKSPTTETIHPTFVILGSGGHTAEMCKMNQALLRDQNTYQKKYQPVRYIVANSDDTSERHLRVAMPSVTKDSDFIRVPRSRSVGQSWVSTIFTTLWSLLWSCWLVWRDRPQLVLCNGPGTCVPYCYAAYMWRLLGRLPAHSRIVFVESYCRVETLSLSGRLLLPLADMFVVHWPALAARYSHKPNIRYFGRIL
ncbi:UDP-N-acetylglucosamine transferase subunit ALG14 homolog [Drosophila grimshawi]|uniref:UDP-N-acetylglucosamine transferase subunit ALG14 n=1 Tax=Drosophila grimshawi TaxID=7222 RepID=B4JJ66_DROGR|nr:UDP-N-acetylglucosamine transferase subunit ALG14 homolog [Drosophila grimshawi]EDV99618.1 GH12321 [Drosophila grimshawi]